MRDIIYKFFFELLGGTFSFVAPSHYELSMTSFSIKYEPPSYNIPDLTITQ